MDSPLCFSSAREAGVESREGGEAVSELNERASAVGRGIVVEWLSIAWMVIEGAAAVGAGIQAHSTALTAFGIDSFVELVAGAALLWRLSAEARGAGEERVERAERAASWIVGAALIALSLYILADSALKLIAHARPEFSALGLAVSAASSLLMPVIANAKKRIGKRIGSRALEADGSCSMVCAYMSWIVLLGVAATAILGWWWIDSVAALGLVYFVAHEGWEALESARERPGESG
ncbi:MAG TPA: cation transporter [Spirochaetia bacterium]|nr:cation transporter [Spirochaetia bacterium]